MDDFGKKLKGHRQHAGISQSKLAELCSAIDDRSSGWRQSRIANYETGLRTPDLQDVVVISKALELKPEKLAFDKEFTIKNIGGSHYYPVLNSVQAGKFTEVIENGDDVEMLASYIKASDKSFFIVIEGESMLDRFKPGDVILIDPTLRPISGKYVVAANAKHELTFKQYIELPELSENLQPHFELVPRNKLFPTISSKDQELTILGVAVGAQSKL